MGGGVTTLVYTETLCHFISSFTSKTSPEKRQFCCPCISFTTVRERSLALPPEASTFTAIEERYNLGRIQLKGETPETRSNWISVVDFSSTIDSADEAKVVVESNSLALVKDDWSQVDEKRIDKYRADVKALEEYKTSFPGVMSSSNTAFGLLGDSKLFDVKNSDDEGSSTKIAKKKKKVKRLIKASENEPRKKSKHDHALEREAILEKNETIPPVSEGAKGIPMRTAMISFLLRSKNLRQDLAKAKAEKKEIEQEKTAQGANLEKEQQVRAAKEQELASLQAKCNELEVKMREYGDSHVSKTDLQQWLVTFWFRVLSSNGMANVMMKINEMAKEFGGHGGDALAIQAGPPDDELRVPEVSDSNIGIELASDDDFSEEMRSGNAGTKEKEPQAEKNAEETFEPTPMQGPESYFNHRIYMMILDEDQAKKFPLYSMISNLLRKREVIHNIRVVKQLEKDILDAIHAYNVQIHSRLMNSLKEKEEEMQRRLHQYDLDYHDSLILEQNIVEEVAHLKEENAKLKADKGIAVSPWFLEKHDILSIVE
ncbi:OLC1v1016248C1 [Oldenlandia corymbosa var. corymbosa]|uniref:OLC1v1016248C1 n=1 Tax=Oldenlandia corymbosa var. corymbosa TaxID=529605 RepID=A0AAV1E7B5_OLDCO|nr:OLC1v1016248C1 [Oldenlandia corymbosa var. corymbosa]